MKSIITDWHGVIDKNSYVAFRVRVATLLGITPNAYNARIREVANAWSDGHIEPAVFWSQFQKEFGFSASEVEDLKMNVLTVNLDQDVVDVFTEYAHRFPLGLLSDCPPDKAAVIKSLPLMSIFQATAFSCDEKKSKKRDDFFLDFIRIFGHDIQRTVFVDDSVRNVERAHVLGFATITFTDAAQLARELESWSHTR